MQQSEKYRHAYSFILVLELIDYSSHHHVIAILGLSCVECGAYHLFTEWLPFLLMKDSPQGTLSQVFSDNANVFPNKNELMKLHHMRMSQAWNEKHLSDWVFDTHLRKAHKCNLVDLQYLLTLQKMS